jgi:hypothetical protein
MHANSASPAPWGSSSQPQRSNSPLAMPQRFLRRRSGGASTSCTSSRLLSCPASPIVLAADELDDYKDVPLEKVDSG